MIKYMIMYVTQYIDNHLFLPIDVIIYLKVSIKTADFRILLHLIQIRISESRFYDKKFSKTHI